MTVQDGPFSPEIEALDENLAQFYYADQPDWAHVPDARVVSGTNDSG